jgi:hypothetical protein
MFYKTIYFRIYIGADFSVYIYLSGKLDHFINVKRLYLCCEKIQVTKRKSQSMKKSFIRSTSGVDSIKKGRSKFTRSLCKLDRFSTTKKLLYNYKVV